MIDYNVAGSGVLAYCNGTNWISFGAGAGLSSGLAGQWKFEEGTGTTVADSSGNGNTLTLAASTATPTWTTGKIGNALSFDNTNDYASASNSASLNITGELTVMAWIKVNAFNPDWNDIVTKGNDAAGRAGYQLIMTSDARPAFYFCTGANATCGTWYGYESDSTTPTITAGSWFHVAFTYKDSTDTIVMYVNGAAQSGHINGGNALITSIVSNTDPLNIGTFASSEASNMVIDDVRIYNRALTAAEIAKIYNGGSGCP
jgi:hypothetical protein